MSATASATKSKDQVEPATDGRMSTYAKVCAANRHKMRSLLVLAALYVIIGLGLAVVSAIAGEPLGAFLGFLIVSCTIGGTALLRAVWRLNAQAAALSDRLTALTASTARLEKTVTPPAKSPFDSYDGPVQKMDLSAIGRGDPSCLAAAVLDQATYPRLVQTMEDYGEPAAERAAAAEAGQDALPPSEDTATPATATASFDEPAVAAQPEAPVAHDSTPAGHAAAPALREAHNGNGEHLTQKNAGHAEVPSADGEGAGPMSRVMMRRWKTAYREGDLPACREVFSVFQPIADPDLVGAMREQLDEVVQRTERRLRMQFQQLVHEQRFAEALTVGTEMSRLLPDHAVTQEFARIRPLLERRLERRPAVSATNAASN